MMALMSSGWKFDEALKSIAKMIGDPGFPIEEYDFSQCFRQGAFDVEFKNLEYESKDPIFDVTNQQRSQTRLWKSPDGQILELDLIDISGRWIHDPYDIRTIWESIDSYFAPCTTSEQHLNIKTDFGMFQKGVQVESLMRWIDDTAAKYKMPLGELLKESILPYTIRSDAGYLREEMNSYAISQIGMALGDDPGMREFIDAIYAADDLGYGCYFGTASNSYFLKNNDYSLYLEGIVIRFLDWLSGTGLRDISLFIDELDNLPMFDRADSQTGKISAGYGPIRDLLDAYQSKFESVQG